MRWSDLLRNVASSLPRLGWRLVLTVLGVVIGTVSMVLMLAAGAGIQRSLTSMLGRTDSATRITVTPAGVFDSVGPLNLGTGPAPGGDKRPAPLDHNAVSALRAVPHVDAVMGRIDVPVQALAYGPLYSPAFVTGVDWEDLRLWGYTLASGRLPTSAREMVVGAQVQKSFSGSVDTTSGTNSAPVDLLGATIDVVLVAGTGPSSNSTGSATEDEVPFHVVGVLAVSDNETDISTFIAADDARILSGSSRSSTYDSVVVRASSPADVASVTAAANAMGFAATSVAGTGRLLDNLMNIVQVALGSIGAIALLVSALGIANTITTSILERTKDIGIMMAVGASRSTVMRMFLAESAVIGLTGGILGLLLAIAIGAVANVLVSGVLNSSAGLSSAVQIFYVPPWLMLFAVSFAGVIGLVAGTFPAARAAQMSPLAAIRRE